VTLGILFALQGGNFRAFYLWLKRGYDDLFAGLTQCPLLQCLLRTHQGWCCRLLAAASFFAVIDSYPIELPFPIRQGGSPQQVGKKGLDKGCWLLNSTGQVVERDWARMNAHDQHFHPVIERVNGQSIALADYGFQCVDGIPDNCKLCTKGTWYEDMCVETALSLVTVIC